MDRNQQAADEHAGHGCPAPSGDVARFVGLWESYAHRIHAYAARHVGPQAAQEVVAETFLVAWRRLQDVPGDPLPWLLVVARNTISGTRRSQHRARTLQSELMRLTATAAATATGPEAVVVEREVMLRGLAGLTEVEREALLLAAWDGLGATQAAVVAGCSTTAFHVRLHRARRRLAGLVDDTEGADSRADTRPHRGTRPLDDRPADLPTDPRPSWRSE